MSAYSVRKPITVLMGILIVIVLGVFSVTKLPMTLFPDINIPLVVTITTYEGQTPEVVEEEVSSKIESSVSTIGNFQEVYSMSYEHFGLSVITFAESTNMDTVIIELRENLNNIDFADNVGSTRILRISPDMMPVFTTTLYRNYEEDLTDEEELIANSEWINRDIMNDLTSIPGVADITIEGSSDTVLQVSLDQDELTLYGLDNDTVLGIIEDQNVGGLIGVALDSGEIRMLYLGDNPESVEEISELPIIYDSGEVVTLDDLAITGGIKYINANTDSYSKINGKQGIQISFQKQSDYGITEVSSSIVKALDDIVANDDHDAEYDVLLDQGEYINRSISSVLQNIIFGAILAIFVLFIFLRDIKPTLIVGLAIPISVIAAFMLMYFTGISLNMISMGGLALGIGMLVDNSIVVIENIYRMVNNGKTKQEAAVSGAKQVAGAITASTITTIAVFVPVAFIEGIVADIFMNMALTIAYSLGASLVIALTMVPAMASRILNDKKDKPEDKASKKIKSWYKTSVLFTIRHKIITYFVVSVLLIGSIVLVVMKGFIMLPSTDEGVIGISIYTTKQATFTEKAEYADEITDIIMAIDDVDTVSTTIASSGSFGMSQMMGDTSSISYTINLKDGRSKATNKYADDILALINAIDITLLGITDEEIVDISISSQDSSMMMLGATGVNIKVSGYDLLTLEAISNDLTAIISDIDGVENSDNGVSKGEDNVKITVNKENAMELGLSSQDVLDNINILNAMMSGLGVAQETTVNIEGIDYTLDLPNDTTGGFSLDMFGTYENFFSGVRLFSDDTRALVEDYNALTGTGVYTFLPTGNPSNPMAIGLNPMIKLSGGTLYYDITGVSVDPTLESLSVAPLYSATPATSVTTIEKVTGFATINTDGSNRYLNVTAEVEDGYNSTIVGKEVTSKVNEYIDGATFASYGNGYSVELAGEAEETNAAIKDLVVAALVAVLLVYMVMAIQFQSLIYPFIILGTVPLAFTGGMIAILITNSFLSMVSLMGLIILVGVVVNNGIVLIDYINKQRESGKDILDAIVIAGQTRIRPIFMTALTTILALLAMAIGTGEGSELLQPMAITSIGGLLYGTVLTLVVVPTIYATLNFRKIKQEVKKNESDEG